MGAEEVSAPRGHYDQTRNPQLGEFGVVAEKGSRPAADTAERQCHRAHELGRVQIQKAVFGKAVVQIVRASSARTHSARLKDCIGTLLIFESQAKTKNGDGAV